MSDFSENRPSYTPPTNQPQQYGAPPKTNVLAIISLVAAFVFPLAGIVTGHIALSQLKTSGEQGRGIAKAGLILSYVFVILGILAAVFWVILTVWLVNTGNTDVFPYPSY